MPHLPASIHLVPTRRLAAAVALLAPAWLLPPMPGGMEAGWVAAMLVAVAIIVEISMLPGMSHIALERRVQQSVGLGEDSRGRYDLISTWPRQIRATVFDSFPHEIERTSPLPPLELTSAWIAAVEFRFTARHRGEFALGDAAVRVSGPMGLVQRNIRYRLTDDISVAPSLAVGGRGGILALQNRAGLLGMHPIRRRGEGRSFSNLRDYVIGDDPRHVDWKHSARRQKLITREFTVERGQTVFILIDSGRMMAQHVDGEVPRFERALSAALVLTSVALSGGDRVGLLTFDDTIRAFLPPASGPAALRAIRGALVGLQPTLVEPDYARAFATLAARHRTRALIVLFSDVLDPRSSRELIAQTSRASARSLPLMVALRNDALFAAALPSDTHGSMDLYRSAAAEEVLTSREEALRRMRASGVSVIDVSPRALTTSVVNRYLEIKSRGAL